MREVEAVVIGAGQAGLSAAPHLQRLVIDFVVLDANDGPGGAWRHRWDSLTMADVHGVADLPGVPAPTAAPPPRTSPCPPSSPTTSNASWEFPHLR
ncbi:NAD(P)-binding protein [Propioniciclava sinopodophylli]|uniref:NAD(P)-binding protein n=1 Tax=Propioniciclava sinopodophylli TaxID=1837344 RepID=UPI003CD0D1C1